MRTLPGRSQEPARRRRTLTHWACPALLGTVLTACAPGDSAEPSAEIRTGLQAAVVGSAAQALGDDGLFAYSPTPLAADELTLEEARRIAVLHIRDFARFLRETLEEDRGGPIDTESLELCGRGYYAESPYEPIPDDVPGLTAPLRRVYGSWWIFGVCGPDGELLVSQAVSSRTSYREVDGRLRPQPGIVAGNDFFTVGVPRGWDSPVGLSPERAALRAAEQTGRSVTGMPRLVASDLQQGYPQSALWEIELNQVARLREAVSGEVRHTQKMYLGLKSDLRTEDPPDGVLRVARPGQQDEIVVRYPILKPRELQRPGESPVSGSGLVTVRRRADLPVLFDRAVPEGGAVR